MLCHRFDTAEICDFEVDELAMNAEFFFLFVCFNCKTQQKERGEGGQLGVGFPADEQVTVSVYD